MGTDKQWNRLPRGMVWPSTLEFFKTWLHKSLGSLIWCHSWSCFKQNVGLETSWGLFQPQFFLWSFMFKQVLQGAKRAFSTLQVRNSNWAASYKPHLDPQPIMSLHWGGGNAYSLLTIKLHGSQGMIVSVWMWWANISMSIAKIHWLTVKAAGALAEC